MLAAFQVYGPASTAERFEFPLAEDIGSRPPKRKNRFAAATGFCRDQAIAEWAANPVNRHIVYWYTIMF